MFTAKIPTICFTPFKKQETFFDYFFFCISPNSSKQNKILLKSRILL